jgi:hypothetical protein
MAVLDLVTSLRRAKYAQGVTPTQIAQDEFINAIRQGSKSQELKRDLGIYLRKGNDGRYYIQSANVTIGDLVENACFANIPGIGSCIGPKSFLHTYEMRYCFENRDDLLIGSKMEVTGSPLDVPFRQEGDTADSVNSRWIALYTAFLMNRAHLLGTETSPSPSLVWSGLAEYYANLNVTSTLGNPITSIEFLSACLDEMIGPNWVNGIHPLGYASMERQLRNSGQSQLNGWSMSNGRLTYNGQPVYKSYSMPFDVQNSTTQLMRVNTDYVGLVEIEPSKAEVLDLLDQQGCMRKCLSWAYGGGVVVTDSRAIQLISSVPVDAACLTALSQNGFNVVNPTGPFIG